MATLQPQQLIKITITVGLISMLYACGTNLPTVQTEVKTTATGNTSPATNEHVVLDPKIEHEFNLGIKAMAERNYAEAEEIFLKMTQAYPNLSGPFANLGTVLAAQKDYPDAESAFKIALRKNPRNAEIYNHLGLLYRQTARFQKALQTYKQGLMIAPNNTNLLRNTGILLELYLNSPSAALEYYQRYLEQKPIDKQVQLWVSLIKQQTSS